MPRSYAVSGTHQRSEFMYPLIELWLESDRSQRSICEEHDIKPHVFSYWRSKYDRENGLANKLVSGDEKDRSSKFISLEVASSAESLAPYFLEIKYKDGTCIRFGQPVDLQALKSLLPTQAYSQH